ncbi:shikimate kinase [bacterium]|nr:shikimate kinase [bacterium]
MNAPLPIFISGMMGTGKSTIGRLIAKQLQIKFIDLDHLIEKTAGMSINDIFNTHGEAHFRSLESRLLLQTSHKKAVISLGGGAILKAQNRDILKRGTWINLHTTATILFKRIGKSKKRPKLGIQVTQETIEALLKARSPFYGLAPLQVETGLFAKKMVADKIIRFLCSRAFPLIKQERI